MPLRLPSASPDASLLAAPAAYRTAVISLMTVGVTSPVVAQTSPPPVVGASTGALLQGLIGLAVIIVLLLVTLAALKRWGGQFGGVSTAGMKVISGLSVGTRERILLVEIGDTWLVLGVTASQIRTLHTLPRGSIPGLTSPENKPAFAQWLGSVMERKRHDS